MKGKGRARVSLEGMQAERKNFIIFLNGELTDVC